MFGVLFGVKEQISFSSQALANLSTQEKHIIIPLSTHLPRVPPLPGATSKPNPQLKVLLVLDFSCICCCSFLVVFVSSCLKVLDTNNGGLSLIHTPSFFNVANALQHAY